MCVGGTVVRGRVATGLKCTSGTSFFLDQIGEMGLAPPLAGDDPVGRLITSDFV